jgi:hypothetical protein
LAINTRNSSANGSWLDFARAFGKKATALIISLFFTCVVQADFKSTFLINGAQYSTLSWLSNEVDNNWRDSVIAKLKSNGDTYADVMARSTADDFGKVNGVNREVWRSRLNRLRDRGIQPVVWLISDDSPSVYKKGLNNQIDYQSKVVSEIDDIVSHYVVCLECNEYYSPEQVSTLIRELKKKTDKPIGVHLTPGVRKAYIKDADIIYLQTGFHLSEQKFRQQIENALKFGKPVVVSEYNLNGTSSEARRFGNIACSYAGVIGTGNGRGKTSCETLKWGETKDKSWYQKNEKELIVSGIAAVTLFVMLNNDDMSSEMFQLYTDDNGYELGFKSGGYNLRYSEDKVLATYRIEF